jgi:hypothetical protein
MRLEIMQPQNIGVESIKAVHVGRPTFFAEISLSIGRFALLRRLVSASGTRIAPSIRE